MGAKNKETLPDSNDLYVRVNCVNCDSIIGYVIEGGHKHWLCDKCSPNGRVQSVGTPAEPPSEE